MSQLGKMRRLLDTATTESARIRRESQEMRERTREYIKEVKKQPVDLIVYRSTRARKKRRAG